MGLDLGIEKAGFDILLACENDKHCRETIKANRSEIALLDDVSQLTKKDVLDIINHKDNEDIDLIMGGPPCQAFSTAGKRKGFNDDRGNVFLKFLFLALDIRPKYLVIENVRGLLSCPMLHRPHNQRGTGFPSLGLDELKGGALNFVLNRLDDAGYGYNFELYNSANFGTPQIRERVIIIASRDGGKPPYLVPTHSKSGKNGFKRWRTFRQAVSRIKKHEHLTFPDKRLKYYEMLQEGQNWRSLPEDLQKEALGKSFYSGGGKTGFLRRLSWNKPAPTLVTHPAMPATDLCHPEQNRPLSIQEYLKIQEFPSNWKLKGPLIQKYKQVGNAVPVGLGNAVGSLLVSLINKKEVKNVSGFKYSRYKITNDVVWRNDFNERVIRSNISNQQLSIL